MRHHTRAGLESSVVPLVPEHPADSNREELAYLVDHSHEHERQLATIRHNLEESTEYLSGRCRQHDGQLTELCDKWALLTNSLTQQAREIEGLKLTLQTVERTAAIAAERAATIAVATSPQGAADGPGRPHAAPRTWARVLYGICCVVAVAALVAGIWLINALVTGTQADAEPSLTPLALIGVSILAAWSALGFRRLV